MILLIQIIIGVFLGLFIGFLPNMHLNLIAYVFSMIPILINPNFFYFFISFSISHLISSYIPTTFFGIPTESTLLSLFPTQRLNLKGKSKLAISLCLLGSLLGTCFSIFLLPFLGILFSLLKDLNIFIYSAIFLSLFLFIFSQKNLINKLIVFSIIIFSGSLGIFTLKYNLFFKEPLFICITSLFSLPFLISSIISKNKGIFQKNDLLNLNYKKYILPSLIGSISSFLIILIPSFSSSQASAIISTIKRKIDEKIYLVIFSAVSISALIFSYFLAMNFFKPRLGYIAILMNLHILPEYNFILFSLVVLFSMFSSTFIIYLLIPKILKIINNINLNLFNWIFLIIILFIMFLISFKWSTLFLIILSTFIGFLPIRYNKSRLFLISYLMIPTLLFYI